MTRPGALAAVAATVLLLAAGVGWSRVGTAVPSPTSSAARSWRSGPVVFRTKGCSQCHEGPDTHSRMTGYPDLTDARSWAGLRRPGLSAAGYVRQSIRDPSSFISPAWAPSGGQPGMPQLSVSEAEVDALVAYLLER